MVRLQATDDLQKLADALKEAADTDLQKQVSAAMRAVAKPLGQRVLAKGSAELPRRGGLADYVAAKGRIGVSNSLRGKTASVTLALRNKGVRFAAMDRGKLRHPVFGRPGFTRKEWTWTQQAIRPGAFSRQFEAEADEVAAEVNKAAQQVLDNVARKV